MSHLIDHEALNARDWDDEAPSSNRGDHNRRGVGEQKASLQKTTPFPVLMPIDTRKDGRTLPSNSKGKNPVPPETVNTSSKIGSATSKPSPVSNVGLPGRKIQNGQTETSNSQGSPISRRGASSCRARYPKFTLVSTSASEMESAEQEKSLWKKAFHEVPLTNDFRGIGYFLWPFLDTRPVQLLKPNLALVDSVREDFEVYVDWVEHLWSLRVRSPSGTKVEEAINEIRAIVNSLQAESFASGPFYMVEPPSVNDMCHAVKPHFKTMENGPEAQPFIERVSLAGRKLDSEEMHNWRNERSTISKEACRRFTHYIMKGLKNLSTSRSGMRMRLHFGHLYFTSYKKDFKDLAYDYHAFSKMVSQRIRTHLMKKMGDGDLAVRTLKRITKFDGLLSPADSVTGTLEYIKPRESIVILLETPQGRSIRLEAGVDQVIGSTKIDYQVGTIVCYVNSSRKTHLSAASIDLESHLDWQLEITSEDRISAPASLIQHVTMTVARSRACVDKHGLHYPAVVMRNSPDATIMSVVHRSTTTFDVKDTDFVLEYTIYRTPGIAGSSGSSLSCGITIFNKDWDAELSPLSHINGSYRERVLNALFPTAVGAASGIPKFLSAITSVREVFKGAMADE